MPINTSTQQLIRFTIEITDPDGVSTGTVTDGFRLFLADGSEQKPIVESIVGNDDNSVVTVQAIVSLFGFSSPFDDGMHDFAARSVIADIFGNILPARTSLETITWGSGVPPDTTNNLVHNGDNLVHNGDNLVHNP